jgi:hypothetical protein
MKQIYCHCCCMCFNALLDKFQEFGCCVRSLIQNLSSSHICDKIEAEFDSWIPLFKLLAISLLLAEVISEVAFSSDG